MSLRIPQVVSTDGDFPIKDCSKTSLTAGTVTDRDFLRAKTCASNYNAVQDGDLLTVKTI